MPDETEAQRKLLLVEDEDKVARSIAKGLREEVQTWRSIEARARDVIGLAELAIAEKDGHLQATLEQDLRALDKDVEKQEIDLLFANPYAEHPALVSIHAGAGGTDSQDWAEMLLRMYLYFFENRGWDVSEIDRQWGEQAGIRRSGSSRVRVTVQMFN